MLSIPKAYRLVRVFVSWLFTEGGMKRAIFVPFVVLLAAAFASSWRLQVGGSREAVFAVVDDLARSGASQVKSELISFLSVPSTIVDVFAVRLSEFEGTAEDSSKLGFLDGMPPILARQLAGSPSLDILSFGLEDGEYAEAQRLFDGTIRYGRAGAASDGALVLYITAPDGSRIVRQRNEGYDPRKRPWYRNAYDKTGVVWSDPYAYISTGTPAVAAAKTIRGVQGEKVLGVVSATVSLNSITSFLSSMEELSGGGAVAIINADGRIIASAVGDADGSAPIKAFLSVNECPPPFNALFGGFSTAESGVVRPVSVGGRRWRVIGEPVKAGVLNWNIVVALPESRFLASLEAAERRIGVIYVAAFMAALIAAFLIAHGISQPLRTLGAAATAFAEQIEHRVDDPRLPHSRALSRMIGRKDELGRLAFSFSELRSHLSAVFKSLNASLAEKDVLLKEVHHRVKNNLQIVSSLVSLQSGEFDDPDFVAAMQTLQNRVHAMAVVHETIYSSGDFVAVQMDDYLSRVSTSLSAYRGANFDLVLAVVPGGVKLPLEQAIPCGLIAVELATNAIKHGFPGRLSGKVELGIRSEAGSIILSVGDDGVGPPSVSGNSGGMGTHIVTALAGQLRGSFSILPGTSGTVAEVRFPAPHR